MWFDLASHLRCTVREAQERIDSAEFSEWCVYRKLSPWGEEREDLRAAQICYWIWAMMRGTDTDQRTLESFVLKFDNDVETDVPKDNKLFVKFQAWAMLHNAKVDAKK